MELQDIAREDLKTVAGLIILLVKKAAADLKGAVDVFSMVGDVI